MTSTTSTTDETSLATVIEAKHKRAMMHADSVTFHTNNGEGYIRLHRRSENSPSGFDDYVEIRTEATVTDYDREYGSVGLEAYQCFHMEHSGPKYDLDLLSLANRISAGDTLRLEWMASNNNELQKNIHWHNDELRLVILKHKTNKRERYLVTARVGPDNTARMVRKVR